VIGARIATRRPPAKGALALLAGGAALAALGMALGVPALVPVAIAPLAIGACLLIVGERGFQARFTPTGMEIAHPRQTITYSTLLEVRPLVPADRPRPDFFPIQVVHTLGAVIIPARLTLSSERVYSFLRGFLADRRPTLPAALDAYRVEQEGSFGPEKVWCYAGRGGRDRPQARNLRAIGAGLVVTAAAWAVIPLRRTDEPGWWMASGAIAFVGAAVLVQDVSGRRRETSARPLSQTTAALVIAPLGLAVEQGAMTGHLTWQEIRNVSVRTGRAGLAWSAAQTLPGIVLEVEGASIVLTDSYDRPLSEIHDRILRYWR